MKIRSIASALLLTALVLTIYIKQNTEGKIGSSSKTSADTDVKTNSWPSTLDPSKLFLFTRNGKYGYIDRTGKIVIPAKLDTPYENSNSATPVGVGEQNENRDELISFEEDDYSTNMRSEFLYKLGISAYPRGKLREYWYGYKNRRTGKAILRPQFRRAADRFSEGLAWVMDEQYRVGYTDERGKMVILPQYSYSRSEAIGGGNFRDLGSDFNGGLAKVCSEGKSCKCGYIDRTGKVVIPLKFDDAAEKFSNGLAWVVINKGFGYIDKTGKVKISVKFTDPSINTSNPHAIEGAIATSNGDGWFIANIDFDRGLAVVKIPKACKSSDENDCDRYGYIDTTGKLVFKF
jgi:WG containing repeat